MAQKACIFGGAFDPPHLGHLNIAVEAQRQFEIQKIFWLPNYHAPGGKEFVASFKQRCDMLRRMLSDKKDHIVEDVESTLQRPSYTLHSITALCQRYPEVGSWYLLMGEDNWASFESWHLWEEIESLCQIIVYPRNKDETLQTKPGGKALWLKSPLLPVSSTQIRSQLKGKDFSLKKKLPEPVIHYIEQNRIYFPGE